MRENFVNNQGETVEEREIVPGDSELNVSQRGSEDTEENSDSSNNNSAMEDPSSGPQLVRRSGRMVKPVKRMDL